MNCKQLSRIKEGSIMPDWTDRDWMGFASKMEEIETNKLMTRYEKKGFDPVMEQNLEDGRSCPICDYNAETKIWPEILEELHEEVGRLQYSHIDLNHCLTKKTIKKTLVFLENFIESHPALIQPSDVFFEGNEWVVIKWKTKRAVNSTPRTIFGLDLEFDDKLYCHGTFKIGARWECLYDLAPSEILKKALGEIVSSADNNT